MRWVTDRVLWCRESPEIPCYRHPAVGEPAWLHGREPPWPASPSRKHTYCPRAPDSWGKLFPRGEHSPPPSAGERSHPWLELHSRLSRGQSPSRLGPTYLHTWE